MKVLLTKKFADSDVSYLKEKLHPAVQLVEPKEYNESGVLAEIDSADVLFGGMLNEAVVSRSGNVKFAQIPWTGIDTLDFALLKTHNLTVCNSHSNATVVAEHAIALAFSLAKKLPYHDSQMRRGNWNRISKDGNAVSPFSKQLFGSRITFIGYGAIAQSAHRLLSSFNPIVKAVTFSGQVKENAPDATMFKTSDILEAVSDADYVYICAPLTSNTRGLVSQSVFEAMPAHSLLINVSRGALVQEEALYDALSSQKIAGAAIDTWYQNPKPDREKNFPSNKFEFQNLDSIVMSPHRAGYIDSGFPHLDDAIVNLNRSISGQPLINVVSAINSY